MTATLLHLSRLFGPLLGTLVGLAVLYAIEMAYLPPVTDFAVSRLERQGDVVVVSGTYRKHRACELLATNIMATSPGQPSALLYQLKLGEAGSNMPVGHVAWGPYRIPVPPTWGYYTHVEAVALHRCHALWVQETHYIRLPVGLFAQKD